MLKCQRPGEQESGKWKGCCDLQGPRVSALSSGWALWCKGRRLCVWGRGSVPALPSRASRGQEYAHCFSFCFHCIKYGSKKTAENTAHFKYLHVTNEGFVRARNVMWPNCAIRRVITGFIENINSSVPREAWLGDGTEGKASSRRSRASSFSGVFVTSAFLCHFLLATLVTHSSLC